MMYASKKFALGLLAFVIMTGCSGSNFGGSNDSKKAFSGGGSAPANGSGSGDASKNPDVTFNTDQENDSNGVKSAEENDVLDKNGGLKESCPKTMQEILILDMKSGWWSGDAGDFIKTLLTGLTQPCGASVSFEYHHAMQDSNTFQVFPNGKPQLGNAKDIEKLALKSDWSQYSQIWILSGSKEDNMDMRLDNPVFQGIVNKIKAAPKVSLFIGSGNGNLTHANGLAEGLGLATKFATTLPEGPVVDATAAFTVVSRLNVGKELTAHALFSRGIKAIADDVKLSDPFGMASIDMKSDYLQMGADFSAVGKSASGQSTIAVRTGAGAKIVLDSGLQRFYAIKNASEKDTLTYLQNIAVYLSAK